MSLLQKLLFAVAAVFAAVAVSEIYSGVRVHALASQTFHSIPGQIDNIRTSVIRSRDRSGQSSEATFASIDFTYTVAGRSYTSSTISPACANCSVDALSDISGRSVAELQAGAAITVLVLPEDPSVAYLGLPTSSHLVWALVGSALWMLLAASIAWVAFQQRTDRRGRKPPRGQPR